MIETKFIVDNFVMYSETTVDTFNLYLHYVFIYSLLDFGGEQCQIWRKQSIDTYVFSRK